MFYLKIKIKKDLKNFLFDENVHDENNNNDDEKINKNKWSNRTVPRLVYFNLSNRKLGVQEPPRTQQQQQ